MASLIHSSIDDKDLDDAALWAVIDSAAASHSASKSRKTPLSIKYPNHQSPATPISPLPKLQQNPKLHFSPNSDSRGEVLQANNYHHQQRPHKMARTCTSEIGERNSSSQLVVVRSAQRTPSATACSSPEAYLSPEIGKCGGVSKEREVMRHSLAGMFPSVSLFKEYQNAAMAILERSDYTVISGKPFIKKSGWRKISFYFNLSFEIKDKTIEFDENRNVQRAEFVVRAHMQGGRFSDGWGSCERREKKFPHPNHDIPSTAETRAKNKASQDLLGIGEYKLGASQFQ
ncbi:hypothetical protein CFOL_v3_12973 [Cephalotus follicularis]|uniref:Uncharacterized protein n=1 Tax=Cephalotus follicularis TaxID=3775 RepID=A0A1Q3BNP1_CEPFO|nr:hypothetical protein CFOL_v3_12973 [Cephalotus follicularis]